jgi:hypothetical protein
MLWSSLVKAYGHDVDPRDVSRPAPIARQGERQAPKARRFLGVNLPDRVDGTAVCRLHFNQNRRIRLVEEEKVSLIVPDAEIGFEQLPTDRPAISSGSTLAAIRWLQAAQPHSAVAVRKGVRQPENRRVAEGAEVTQRSKQRTQAAGRFPSPWIKDTARAVPFSHVLPSESCGSLEGFRHNSVGLSDATSVPLSVGRAATRKR